MTAFPYSACFFLCVVFLLSFTDAAPAPVAEGDLAQSQALDFHNTEAGSSRCYYNFQHYEEGDRIITNEPCLNCTCHKRMLMCYLRVCPFTKPVGQDCTVEKKPDQCCPVITCPEVPVDIMTSSTTDATSSSAVGHISKYGCTLEDNTFYPDGVQMPSDPKKPCELCYCIHNNTACVRQECTLNVEGCKPVYQEGVCCPVRYDCDYNEITTTERPSTGGLMLGTTASPTQECRYGDIVYNDGELIETDKPCESCYCMRGDIVCAVRSCGEPMEGKDCHALPPPEGQCCPTTFQCENGTISVDNLTTESSMIIHPSQVETDEPTKEPEPQSTAEEASDAKEEETVTDKKDEEAASSIEVLPSDSPKEDENEESKHEEDKTGVHPDESIQSEPTDTDDLEEEEALDNIPEHPDHEPGTQGPDISEQLATSAPNIPEKDITESQSNIISHKPSSEESPAQGMAESSHEDNEVVNEGQESVKDKVKPSDDSESAGSEGENGAGSSEFIPENQEFVTETANKPEETSENKLEVESGHEGSESTATEVTHSGESEHPDEPTIAKDPVLTNLLDKKDEVVPTEAEEEKQPIPIAPEESVPSGTHNVEAIKPDTSESTGTEADETQTESNKDILSTGESIVETHKKPEIENESVTTNENEIKYEETPSKTPESLDQVKEPEIYTEKDVPSATEKPELHASEGSASTDDNKQGTNNDQLKEEEVVNPEQPSIEVTASPAPSEEDIPEASEHFHKEPAPPRKEDASPEELEQRPQHPEGSMTKAEDSISDSQDQTEVTVTKMPDHVEEAETPQSVEHPSEVDKTPVDTTENNINHDGGDESLNTAGIQEGQDQETPDVQTEQTIISETPTGQNSQEHEIQPSEVSELPETSDSEHKTTEPATAPVSGSEAAPATDDIESEETEVTADESQPTELPKEEHSESHEDESVPTVVVIEPESETQTDSLPEETSHDEVKPTTVPSQDIIHNQSSDEENGHQSLQTGKPVETEEETTESGEEEHPVAEKQPASDNNAENENISSESTQSPPEVIVVEDHMTQDNTEHTSHNEDITPSTDTFDNSESSDTQEKESENVTDQEVTGGIPDKTQEESIPTKVDSSSTEKEIVSSPEADQSPLPEKEAVEQIHPDTAENVESLNELKPDESDKHEAGTPTESSVTGEESTETLVKTGNEEAESEKKGDEFITESKPTEAMESHEPESDSLAEVHHDPVESEPTEFENEIVDDHLLGQGGAIDNEMPMVIPGPIGVIPGEGDCLVEGQTYTNNSNIPSKSPCHKECTCISSVVHCQGIDCDPPPPELANCMPVHQGDLCCPMYACDGDTPEGPQSHNQMGANEDHTTTHEAQTPESGSDIKEHSEEPGATEQPTTLTEESELVHTPDHASSESETHKTDDEHQPMPHEEESSQGGETSPPAENVPESSEGGNPEETPGKTELNESSPEKENITPSPDAGVQEHEDQSVDDKHPGESSTEKSDTPGEDLEIKPDSEASPSEEILTEGEKEIQPTVLTDQSEPSGAESEEATATETSAVDEPSSQPDKNNIVSEQENLTGPNENEQPHKPEAPITEISQTSTDETEGSAGHKASESAVQIDSTLETGTQAPPEGTDENLHSEIEEITGEQTTNKITQEEAQSETEVSVEQTPSSGVHHDPSEEFEHEKESETVSTDLSVDQSNDQSEDSHKPSTETHASDAVEDEDTEHNVQEIVTDSSIVGSQDDGVKKETQETQEPNEPEILVTSNPNVEETGQQGEPTESNNNVSEPESEGHIEPSEAAKPQTVHIPSVSLLNEDSATELVSKPTESSLDENLPNVENEGLSTDTKGEISPTYSTTGEEQINSEQKPLNELETEGSKPEEDHKINETRDETVTSAVVPENEISHETKPSNTETPPRPEEEETDTHETLAPEEPAHDDTSETEVQNEEITENSVEVHHGSSTQTPSFDGPSTQEPSFDAEHGDQTHQEATKGPETIEESVPSKGTSEKEEAPESDNLITDDKHVTSSEHPEGTQDQSQESSSVGTDDKPQLEDDSDKHELETTESSKHGNSETSETTITPESLPEEHISESPTQEPQQAEHETVEPPHDIQGPSQESSEPAMPEDSHLEEEIIHEGIEDDHEEEVLPAHPESTEIPIEEEIHEEGEHNNEGVIPPHEEVVSTNTVEETSTEPVEHTDDEIEPAHEDTAPVHEETVPAHEDTAPVHEETVSAHEETSPVREESAPAHEETAAAHEESATTHEGTETIHEETGLAHEETEPTQDETQPAQEDTEPAHEGTEPAPEETEPVHVETETTHEETETAHDGNEPIHEENEPVHEENKPVHEEKEPIHEENEPVHEENEPVHQENEPIHEENEPVHEENESVHEENEPVHEENEPVHEATEGAHQVPIHEGVSVNEPEADPSSNEANETEHPSESEITNESEQTHRPETEHEDEHPIVEPEHPDSGHHEQEPEPQTHETDQRPNENVIGELEHPTHETQPEVHEPEQTIHEEGISHTQDSGSFPSMPGVTHTVEDSKPHHSKPDNPELPSEDQFTPDVDMDYDVSEDGAFGPGTCRYGGKVYVSAQQIPRDDPCDFCFCFRSDIICLQQSCPPPIHRCHQEPIQGYCCPRYQCPVSMATSLNITTTTSTTTTTLPPHFFAHAYRGAARQSGCFHRGRAYEVGEEIASASGPCLQCICGSDGQMSCDPKVCNPEPMVRKLMEAAVSHRRR